MAILATAVWEMRADGDNDNGGGFDAGITGYGTDYSQQATAQLSITDLAMVAGGTTITSATGGFTSQMVGNALHISGTNFVTNKYFITGYTDTNIVTIDRDATNGSNASSGVAKVGGALAMFTDAIAKTMVDGNICHVKKGNYTATETFTFTGGSAGNNIKVCGYNLTRCDNPTTADQPVFNMGAYIFTRSNQMDVYNIDLTGTGTSVMFGSTSTNDGTAFNCRAVNTSGSANRNAFYGGNTATPTYTMIGCQAKSDNGNAYGMARGNTFKCCMAYDSVNGWEAGANNSVDLTGCVAKNCTNGVKSTRSINNCVIYGCSVGVASGASVRIFSSIIAGNTTGFSTASTFSNLFYKNIWDNDTDFNNAVAGDFDIIADPLLTDPDNYDFTLQAGSPALDTGFDYSKIGLTGDYKWNIGIDQDNQSSGGSSSLGGYAFVV